MHHRFIATPDGALIIAFSIHACAHLPLVSNAHALRSALRARYSLLLHISLKKLY